MPTLSFLMIPSLLVSPKHAVSASSSHNRAVDAHVGKALFADAILGALRNQGKTVILVTHALYFLSQCDYIYTLENGRVEEQGSYQDLMDSHGEFARLIKEFGGKEKDEEDDAEEATDQSKPVPQNRWLVEEKEKSETKIRSGAGTGKLEGRLIRPEKRTTGSVSWKSKSFNGLVIYLLKFLF